MNNDYIVVKCSDIEDYLSDEELETFYGLLNHIDTNIPDKHYIVVDEEAPYASKVLELQKNNEPAITKVELLSNLRELTEIRDPEITHVEADELLIKYINDKDIERAFDEVPKWYS